MFRAIVRWAGGAAGQLLGAGVGVGLNERLAGIVAIVYGQLQAGELAALELITRVAQSAAERQPQEVKPGGYLRVRLPGFPELLVAEIDGEMLFLTSASPGDVKEDGEEKGDGDDLDARVLALRKVDGRRVRSFREAVALLTETDWADGWPVRGPRTLRWVLKFIGENSTHPLAHHGRFRQLVGLPASDPGMQEHERAMRILEISIVYDQL